jgi:SAM-dependent methyltransferase
LEVGCGTGKATVPLAQNGFAITAVELGAKLAAVARRNLAEFERVTVHQGSLSVGRRSAASHRLTWCSRQQRGTGVAPEIGSRRARELLRPGGHLSFWSATHVLPDGGASFFTGLQDVYEEIGEALPDDAVWYRPGKLPDDGDAVRDSDLFDKLQVRQFDWEIVYDADSYLALLDTFSGHIARCSRGSESGCTRRSAVGLRNARTVSCTVTGARSCMSRAPWRGYRRRRGCGPSGQGRVRFPATMRLPQVREPERSG